MLNQALNEIVTGGRLKGGMFRSRLQWIRENGGESLLKSVLQRLPDEEARRQLSGTVLSTAWLPFAWIVELDRAIAEEFRKARRDVLRDLGRYSALANAATTHRLLERKTPHDFFRASALLHSQFQDFGSVSYEQTGPTAGRRIQTNCTFFSPVFCASAIGYYEGCIETHGGTSISVVETECQCSGGTTCTFDMRWT